MARAQHAKPQSKADLTEKRHPRCLNFINHHLFRMRPRGALSAVSFPSLDLRISTEIRASNGASTR